MTKDANQKKAAETTIDEQINEELRNWSKEGLSPSAVQFVPMFSEVKLATVVEFLIETRVVTEEELDTRFKENLLKNLRQARSEIGPEVRKKQIASAIELPPGARIG